MDSDEEAVQQLHEAQANRERLSQRSVRGESTCGGGSDFGGNMTSADLPLSGDVVITEAKSKKRITLTLNNRADVVCAVCGQSGHTAGFIGAV